MRIFTFTLLTCFQNFHKKSAFKFESLKNLKLPNTLLRIITTQDYKNEILIATVLPKTGMKFNIWQTRGSFAGLTLKQEKN